MSQLHYRIVIEPLAAADGGGFLARVPDLPGCMSDGSTPEAAVRNIQDAIAEWIDAAHRLGRSIPSPQAISNPEVVKAEASFDPEADAMAIWFKPDDARYDSSEELAPGLVLDFDTEGRVIGVEILGVRRFLERRRIGSSE